MKYVRQGSLTYETTPREEVSRGTFFRDGINEILCCGQTTYNIVRGENTVSLIYLNINKELYK